MNSQIESLGHRGATSRRRSVGGLALALLALFATRGSAFAQTGRRPETPAQAIDNAARAAVANASASASAVDNAIMRYGKMLPAPATGRWQFKVYYGDYTSGLEVALLDYVIERDGERYRAYTEGRATGILSMVYSGLLTQSSHGRVGANGLVPERYVERRGSRPPREVSINYRAGRVEFSGKPSAALREGIQDQLSALVQLGLIARASPERMARGATVEFAEASTSRVETIGYRSLGETALETVRGPIRAMHIERVRSDGEEHSRVEVWLGYDRKLIPVRLRITSSNGRVLDQMIAE